MSDSPTKKKRFQAIQEFRSTHKDAETPLLSEEAKKYDPTASTDDLISDLRRVQDENPDTYITRKKYRKLGKYSDSTWDSRFGTFHEFRRQARLELSRGQQTLEKRIAKHASLDTYHGFMEVEVLPWHGKYERDHTGRWQTMALCSDMHDKLADPFAKSVFLDTCKRTQPNKIVLVGDIYDSMEFSRFDKDPRLWDAAGRLKFVRDDFYRPLREACPEAEITLHAGNHEHHMLRHMAERTPELRAILSDFMGLTFADLLGLKESNINLVCQHDLSAYTPAATRNEIRKNRKTYYGCVTADHYPDDKFDLGTNWVCGHTHKPRVLTGCNEVFGGLWGMNLGAMMTIDNSYTDKNRNQNGFGLVHVDTHKKHCIAEPIIFSDSACMVGGMLYSRP